MLLRLLTNRFFFIELSFAGQSYIAEEPWNNFQSVWQNASMSKKIVDGGHGNSDKNSRSCHVLSVALSDIISHSVNVDFRDRCFEVSQTDNSFDARAAFAADLLSIVSHNSARERQKEATENETTRNTKDET